MKEKPNSQTAYQHNAHSLSSSEIEVNDHGWVKAINRMIDQRYAFLALKYETNGYLFRGMSSGLFSALLDKQFWHYSGEESGSHFEKELDVLLVSQDFSDALTVSKLWEQKLDACILVLRSEIFNQALAEKKAAMMATAEPGVVFKYPFLTQPLTLDDVEHIIVSVDLLDVIQNKKNADVFNEMDEPAFSQLSLLITEMHDTGRLLITEGTKEDCKRSNLEQVLIKNLSKRNIAGAKAINSDIKPKRKV